MPVLPCVTVIMPASVFPHVDLLTKSKAGAIYAVGNVEALQKVIRTCKESEKYRSAAVNLPKSISCRSWLTKSVLKKFIGI